MFIYIKLKQTLWVVQILFICFSGAVRYSNKVVRVALNKETKFNTGAAGQPLTAYYLNVDVGTPPKPFKMLLDINAKEAWLPHYLTFGIIYDRLHYSNGYAKKSSSSSVKENREYSIQYQGCELTGKAYEDTIKFSNISESYNPVSFRQRFLAISSASNGALSNYYTDGVLNLNPAVISDTGTRSFLVNMNQNNLIDELKFGLLLNNNLNSSDGGELFLGGSNPTKYVGNVYYHQLATKHNRWELSLQNVMLGGQLVSCHQQVCTAVLSTGVNDLYGPIEDVRKIMLLLGVTKRNEGWMKKADDEGNELYEIDCLRVVDLPIITINIGGMSYPIPPSMYVKKKIDGAIFKSSTCYVTIFGNKTKNQWILGTNFLSNYYSIFDFNGRQVGLAARAKE